MDDATLFRALTNQVTDAERRAVDVWRASSPAHEARYQSLRQVLALTGATQAPVTTAPPAALDLLAVAARRGRERSTRQSWRRVAMVASGVAALVTAAVALDRMGVVGTRDAFGFEEMVTGDSQTVTVSLRDGSVMRLAPRSRARIRVREGEREVHLTGRAFFSVARRNGIPFKVRTAGGDVTVLGTQFDVDATNDDVRLVVVEGRVALEAARGGEARVERGQEARVIEGRLQPTVALAEARRETRWVGRFLAFQGTPLPEVAADIERAYGARVTIADSLLRDQTITNWFSDRPLDEVVRVVCAIVATECVVQSNEVTIGKPTQ